MDVFDYNCPPQPVHKIPVEIYNGSPKHPFDGLLFTPKKVWLHMSLSSTNRVLKSIIQVLENDISYAKDLEKFLFETCNYNVSGYLLEDLQETYKLLLPVNPEEIELETNRIELCVQLCKDIVNLLADKNIYLIMQVRKRKSNNKYYY